MIFLTLAGVVAAVCASISLVIFLADRFGEPGEASVHSATAATAA